MSQPCWHRGEVAVIAKSRCPAKTDAITVVAVRLQIDVRPAGFRKAKDRLETSPKPVKRSQEWSISFDPHALLKLLPPLVLQCQPGPQNVVADDTITDMRPDYDKNRAVLGELGPQCRHDRHHPLRVVLFGHAAILPPTLHGVWRRRKAQVHGTIRQRRNQHESIAADDSVHLERTGLSGHRKTHRTSLLGSDCLALQAGAGEIRTLLNSGAVSRPTGGDIGSIGFPQKCRIRQPAAVPRHGFTELAYFYHERNGHVGSCNSG